jgi:hypothetical protein
MFYRNGLRESNVTTKYIDVNDMYSENCEDSHDEHSDNEQSFNRNDQSVVSFTIQNEGLI